MKVMKCSQNNLSKPSFGLEVRFAPGDTSTMKTYLPNYRLISNAMGAINMSPEAEYTPPSTVYLTYEGQKTEPRNIRRFQFRKKITDKWSVGVGEFKPETFEIPRKSSLETVDKLLSRAVRAFCKKVCDNPLEALAKRLKLPMAV